MRNKLRKLVEEIQMNFYLKDENDKEKKERKNVTPE